jgi:hypothetical protein
MAPTLSAAGPACNDPIDASVRRQATAAAFDDPEAADALRQDLTDTRYREVRRFPARKFLQMGWTRARRYANHTGGRKYDPKTGQELPRAADAEKAAAAAVFYERYVTARQHPAYVRL